MRSTNTSLQTQTNADAIAILKNTDLFNIFFHKDVVNNTVFFHDQLTGDERKTAIIHFFDHLQLCLIFLQRYADDITNNILRAYLPKLDAVPLEVRPLENFDSVGVRCSFTKDREGKNTIGRIVADLETTNDEHYQTLLKYLSKQKLIAISHRSITNSAEFIYETAYLYMEALFLYKIIEQVKNQLQDQQVEPRFSVLKDFMEYYSQFDPIMGQTLQLNSINNDPIPLNSKSDTPNQYTDNPDIAIKDASIDIRALNELYVFKIFYNRNAVADALININKFTSKYKRDAKDHLTASLLNVAYFLLRFTVDFSEGKLDRNQISPKLTQINFPYVKYIPNKGEVELLVEENGIKPSIQPSAITEFLNVSRFTQAVILINMNNTQQARIEFLAALANETGDILKTLDPVHFTKILSKFPSSTSDDIKISAFSMVAMTPLIMKHTYLMKIYSDYNDPRTILNFKTTAIYQLCNKQRIFDDLFRINSLQDHEQAREARKDICQKIAYISKVFNRTANTLSKEILRNSTDLTNYELARVPSIGFKKIRVGNTIDIEPIWITENQQHSNDIKEIGHYINMAEVKKYFTILTKLKTTELANLYMQSLYVLKNMEDDLERLYSGQALLVDNHTTYDKFKVGYCIRNPNMLTHLKKPEKPVVPAKEKPVEVTAVKSDHQSEANITRAPYQKKFRETQLVSISEQQLIREQQERATTQLNLLEKRIAEVKTLYDKLCRNEIFNFHDKNEDAKNEIAQSYTDNFVTAEVDFNKLNCSSVVNDIKKVETKVESFYKEVAEISRRVETQKINMNARAKEALNKKVNAARDAERAAKNAGKPKKNENRTYQSDAGNVDSKETQSSIIPSTIVELPPVVVNSDKPSTPIKELKNSTKILLPKVQATAAKTTSLVTQVPVQASSSWQVDGITTSSRSSVRLAYLDEACKHLIFLKKILSFAVEDSDPVIIHYALLYNISRCFESLKNYSRAGGHQNAIDKADVESFRNMICHRGPHAIKENLIAVMGFAKILVDQLPAKLSGLSHPNRYIFQNEMPEDTRTDMITAFGDDQFGRARFRNQTTMVISDHSLYKALQKFHNDKPNSDLTFEEYRSILETFIPAMRNILSTLENKQMLEVFSDADNTRLSIEDREKVIDNFLEEFFFHLHALRMLTMICGEFKRYFKKTEPNLYQFIKYCNDIRNPAVHSLRDMDAPLVFLRELMRLIKTFDEKTILEKRLSVRILTEASGSRIAFFNTAGDDVKTAPTQQASKPITQDSINPNNNPRHM